jgi:putative ATP-dependent endonuclease of OLD family
MYITKIKINNFKCFENYKMDFNEKINVFVGTNDVGKSTLLEAIHLCLTGFFRGKYLKNNLVQDIFNYNCVKEYLNNINNDKSTKLPKCSIELYFNDYDPLMLGKENSEGENVACISYTIEFDSKYSDEYEFYIHNSDVYSVPIEYYKITWQNSAGKDILSRAIPINSTIIDTSECNLRNSSDSYVSKIVKEDLSETEIIKLSQLYRYARDTFIENELMKAINLKLSGNTHLLNTKIELDLESLKANEWEKNIITRINSIPFEYVGKGIQSAVKIELSLNVKNDNTSNVLLIEEPENHLSYPKMNKLINEIILANSDKQIFITTHNSFVANKLNIKNLILLNENNKYTKFESLNPNTFEFFMKKPGYDTLRFLLCKKAILVEGDADELVLQKAYFKRFEKLPIENEIDVISVGTTFLRFLELADLIKKNTVVVTDNDGDISALESKYSNYLGKNKKDYIKIEYDKEVHTNQGSLKAKNGGQFNYDTLEPCIFRANSLKLLNSIFNEHKETDDEMIKYMVNNKTECALKVFDTSEEIKFPQYIEDAIDE